MKDIGKNYLIGKRNWLAVNRKPKCNKKALIEVESTVMIKADLVLINSKTKIQEFKTTCRKNT